MQKWMHCTEEQIKNSVCLQPHNMKCRHKNEQCRMVAVKNTKLTTVIGLN